MPRMSAARFGGTVLTATSSVRRAPRSGVQGSTVAYNKLLTCGDMDWFSQQACVHRRSGRTETGLYGMLAAVRRGWAVAVVVPDVGHLRHVGCLAGADPRTAALYLRARLLPWPRTPLPTGRRRPLRRSPALTDQNSTDATAAAKGPCR